MTQNSQALARLLDELGVEDDEQAEAAALRLGAQGEAAIPLIQAVLSGAGDEDQRWWAARALAEVPGPAALDLLVQTLRDHSPAVRQCAALGLRKSLDPVSIPALALVLSDPDPLCADLAVDSLTLLGEAAVPALLEVLASGAQGARLRAVRALALIGDKRAIPALFAALSEDSVLMDYWANEGLDRMGLGMVFFDPG